MKSFLIAIGIVVGSSILAAIAKRLGEWFEDYLLFSLYVVLGYYIGEQKVILILLAGIATIVYRVGRKWLIIQNNKERANESLI